MCPHLTFVFVHKHSSSLVDNKNKKEYEKNIIMWKKQGKEERGGEKEEKNFSDTLVTIECLNFLFKLQFYLPLINVFIYNYEFN